LRDAKLLDLSLVQVGSFCELTKSAVEELQRRRGLLVSGVCDKATWLTLVESSFQLGDRLNYFSSPLQRGDDVAELQELLARTGFDFGRVDGYLGKKTAASLKDFQSNYGLVVDGICGPITLQALRRASQHSGNGPGVGVVRERHVAPKYSDDLSKFRVVVGQFGALDNLTHELCDRLRAQRTNVAVIHDDDPHRHAQLANDFAANLYIGIETRDTSSFEIAYYHTKGFHSVTGHVFATLAAEAIGRSAPWFSPIVAGMRLQVLRETAMPAVLCGLGPLRVIYPHSTVIADNLAKSIATWVKTTSS
jgi:N-acetylmuramoyl-L-alanine amidase